MPLPGYSYAPEEEDDEDYLTKWGGPLYAEATPSMQERTDRILRDVDYQVLGVRTPPTAEETATNNRIADSAMQQLQGLARTPGLADVADAKPAVSAADVMAQVGAPQKATPPPAAPVTAAPEAQPEPDMTITPEESEANRRMAERPQPEIGMAISLAESEANRRGADFDQNAHWAALIDKEQQASDPHNQYMAEPTGLDPTPAATASEPTSGDPHAAHFAALATEDEPKEQPAAAPATETPAQADTAAPAKTDAPAQSAGTTLTPGLTGVLNEALAGGDEDDGEESDEDSADDAADGGSDDAVSGALERLKASAAGDDDIDSVDPSTYFGGEAETRKPGSIEDWLDPSQAWMWASLLDLVLNRGHGVGKIVGAQANAFENQAADWRKEHGVDADLKRAQIANLRQGKRGAGRPTATDIFNAEMRAEGVRQSGQRMKNLEARRAEQKRQHTELHTPGTEMAKRVVASLRENGGIGDDKLSAWENIHHPANEHLLQIHYADPKNRKALAAALEKGQAQADQDHANAERTAQDKARALEWSEYVRKKADFDEMVYKRGYKAKGDFNREAGELVHAAGVMRAIDAAGGPGPVNVLERVGASWPALQPFVKAVMEEQGLDPRGMYDRLAANRIVLQGVKKRFEGLASTNQQYTRLREMIGFDPFQIEPMEVETQWRFTQDEMLARIRGTASADPYFAHQAASDILNKDQAAAAEMLGVPLDEILAQQPKPPQPPAALPGGDIGHAPSASRDQPTGAAAAADGGDHAQLPAGTPPLPRPIVNMTAAEERRFNQEVNDWEEKTGRTYGDYEHLVKPRTRPRTGAKPSPASEKPAPVIADDPDGDWEFEP